MNSNFLLLLTIKKLAWAILKELCPVLLTNLQEKITILLQKDFFG